MPKPEDLLREAREEIGYTESPPGSNRTKFAAEAGHANGTYWCSTFVVALMKRVGLDHEPAYSAATAVMLSKYREAGRLFKVPEPGDLVIYDFPGGRVKNDPSDHIGIVEKVETSGLLVTIEGNTSSGNSGSQSNGGGVFRRFRTRDYVVGFARPRYEEEDTDVKKEELEAILDKRFEKLEEQIAFVWKDHAEQNEDGTFTGVLEDVGGPGPDGKRQGLGAHLKAMEDRIVARVIAAMTKQADDA